MGGGYFVSQRRKLLSIKEGGELPEGIKEVEWVKAGMIDTGIESRENLWIQVYLPEDERVGPISGGGGDIFAALSPTARINLGFYMDTPPQVRCGFGDRSGLENYISREITDKYMDGSPLLMERRGRDVYINGDYVEHSLGNFTQDGTHIFYRDSLIKIKTLKIYDEYIGNILFDGISARNVSSQKYGMFDYISKTFISGAHDCGPDV